MPDFDFIGIGIGCVSGTNIFSILIPILIPITIIQPKERFTVENTNTGAPCIMRFPFLSTAVTTLLALFLVSVPAAQPQGDGEWSIVVNEFMYDPPCILGDDDDYEWIEIYNYGEEAVDLTGWFLNDVELSGGVEPHSFFIIARQDESDPDGDGEYFSVFYNEDNDFDIRCWIFDAMDADLGLDNMSGIIALYDTEHVLVDCVEYSRHESRGHTVEKVCPFLGSGEGHWCGCKEERKFGTPDYQNTRLLLSSALEVEAIDETGRKFQNNITIRNNTFFESDISAWAVVYHIASERSIKRPIEVLHLEPYEEITIEKVFDIPAFFPAGGYMATVITGMDGGHSFAPENEEFSVTALTIPRDSPENTSP